jgi:two-component system cell cycle response regulator DivK
MAPRQTKPGKNCNGEPELMTDRASRPRRDKSSAVVKVLYVEDNDDDVYMLKMRLELLGNFEVLTAEDGEKGCEMAASERPDIILMDLEMPVVDGWEATRRLKGNPQTRDIPIIALSARLNSSVLSQPFGRYCMAAKRATHDLRICGSVCRSERLRSS